MNFVVDMKFAARNHLLNLNEGFQNVFSEPLSLKSEYLDLAR